MPASCSGSVLDAIGGTPLVELARITQGLDGRLLAKLEYFNPGGSKKDRIALQIVEQAEESGELEPGQAVVELTSGNTGAGLAMVCAVKGHPFVAVMSRGNSAERARMMRAFGAEVTLVDQTPDSTPGQVSGPDLELVEAAAREIVAERDAFYADQFNRPGNSRAHELHTGVELWEQSEGAVAAFCDFVGTGGTLGGVARALKARNPAIACYAVEPAGAPALAGGEISSLHHRIQGGGYARRDLPLLDRELVDSYLTVTDEAALRCTRRLAEEEGIFAGFSGGANVAAALQLLEGPHRGQVVAVVIADSGFKYLSTDLWAGEEVV